MTAILHQPEIELTSKLEENAEMCASRGALDLLSSYGDDSSDDEVPGPRVSTKRALSESDEEKCVPKRIVLPLPDIIGRFSNPGEQHADDPELHGGRVRSFRHERGNWATYVFIQYKMNHYMEDVVETIKNMVPNVELQETTHCHVSLTRTVVLRHHWIDLFVESIKKQISFIRRFVLMFGAMNVYCNDERTRTFIGLEVKTGLDTLARLVEIMDGCLADFKLEPFYEDPSFHLSIIWCTGDRESELNSLLPKLNESYFQMASNIPQEHLMVYVNNVQCKTGNKLFTFPLV